jgi:hypothetical protein
MFINLETKFKSEKYSFFSLSHRKESSEDKLSACLLADPLSTDFDQRTAHVQKSRRKA